MSDRFRGSTGSHRLPQLPQPQATKAGTGWIKSNMPTKLPEKRASASAKVVMHQFARSEVRLLDQEQKNFYQMVALLLAKRPEFSDMGEGAIEYLVSKASDRLQQSQLTINFRADEWFTTENNYSSYTQMYERKGYIAKAEDGSREVRLPADKLGTLNPTRQRDAADNAVTFGTNPPVQDRGGIDRFMRTGGVVSKKDSNNKSYFKIQNGQFNTKSRQIFAALNYGRRPRGSNTQYGKSVLILNPGLKRNAIYFLGDTFDLDLSHRISYKTLAAVFLHAKANLLSDLIDCLFRDVVLPDTEDPQTLLEAHIFEQVTFKHDVEAMVIDPSESSDTIRINASNFAAKHGIRLKL